MDLLIITDQRRPRRLWVSILVFVELAPGLYYKFYGPGILIEFQSLFLWNSRPDRPRSSGDRDERVSILVFVELAPGHGESFELEESCEVSILVFVELAPGLQRHSSRPFAREYSFNPCFCGTRARTGKKICFA